MGTLDRRYGEPELAPRGGEQANEVIPLRSNQAEGDHFVVELAQEVERHPQMLLRTPDGTNGHTANLRRRAQDCQAKGLRASATALATMAWLLLDRNLTVMRR